MASTSLQTSRRVHAYDYKEFRAKFAPWAPDTTDAVDQDYIVRLWEPTGARGMDDKIGTGTYLFGRLFFPKATRKLMSLKRIEFLMLLDNQRLAFSNFMGHRTFGKTTWMIIFGNRQMAMRFSRHMLYTSSEYKIAARRTETMRAAFVSPEFTGLFGNMRPTKINTKINTQFSEDTYFLADPVTGYSFACISPRGSNQAVNGAIAPLDNGDFARVDLILNDDGQPRKHIHNATVRQTYEEWLEDELFQTVETDEQPDADGLWPANENQQTPWRIVMGDSCKHRLGVSLRYATKPGWTNRVFPAAYMGPDEKWYSAHEIYSDDTVRAMANRMKPDSWAREFLCQPASADSTVYKQTMFSHVSAKSVLTSRRGNLFKFGVVDPSRVGHERANPTSLLAVLVDLSPGGKITFAENVVKNMEPEVYYARMFQMCKDWGLERLYIEDTGVANVMRNAIKTHAQLTGMSNAVELCWLSSKRSTDVEYGSGPDAIKVARAAAPLPFYRMGLIQHDHSMDGRDLEKSCLEWPECSDWGATDTAGYVPEILELEGIALDGMVPDVDRLDEEESEDYAAAGAFFRGGCRV